VTQTIGVALELVDRWLADHRDRTASPFHPLAGFLRLSARDCANIVPMSCNEYESMLRARTWGPGLPFSDSPIGAIAHDVPVESFMNTLDGALLDRMVHDHLLGLLGHLSRRPGGCAFLDYGTGPACGLHGQEHAGLYPKADIDVRRVRFVGLDKFVLPSRSVFPNASYVQRDLAEFNTKDCFDLISAHHVLEHIRDWKSLLASASKVLLPGGFAFFSFPAFGGLYDVIYRLLTREDHIATYELDDVISSANDEGLELTLAAPYSDPRMRFFWLPSVEPTVSPELQSAIYDLCVFTAARTRLLLHHYGYYLVFRRR
jgi:SAM-dependent methyltransferase